MDKKIVKKEKSDFKIISVYVFLLLLAISIGCYYFYEKSKIISIDQIELGDNSPLQVVDAPQIEMPKSDVLQPPAVHIDESRKVDVPNPSSCTLPLKQISLALAIKENIYTNQNIQDQLDQLMAMESSNEKIRKNIDVLQGLQVMTLPTFASLKKEFQLQSQSLIIDEKLKQVQNFFSKLIHQMIYKVVLVKNLSDVHSELEDNIVRVQAALEDHDIYAAKKGVDSINSQEENFKNWQDKFKALYQEIAAINSIIAELLATKK